MAAQERVDPARDEAEEREGDEHQSGGDDTAVNAVTGIVRGLDVPARERHQEVETGSGQEHARVGDQDRWQPELTEVHER